MVTDVSFNGFNRNILGCKDTLFGSKFESYVDLIETYWDVKTCFKIKLGE